MKLNLNERIIITTVVPEKGNFETMSTIEGLRKKMYPSQEEVLEYEVIQTGNLIKWNEKGIKEVDIDLTVNEFDLINKCFENLSLSESLTFDMYNIFKKIKTDILYKPKQQN